MHLLTSDVHFKTVVEKKEGQSFSEDIEVK